MTSGRFALVMLLLVGIGCNSQRPPPTPARFEQPNAVDFACVVDGAVANLNRCRGDASDDNDISLHALVTQHSRGEIAGVDLEDHKVLDSRRDIPGYTFVPVGQLPIAIVVPPEHPDLTYVADFGSSDVRVLKTLSLVTPLSGSAEVQNVPLMTPSGAGMVPAAPTQMVLAHGENALLVSAPGQGRVLWLPIQRCDGEDAPADCHEGWIDTAGISSIDLRGSADLIAADDAPPAAEKQYEKLCGYKRVAPKPAAPIELSPEQLEPAPRPSGLAVDAFCQRGATECTHRLLVADEALPLIHSIDMDAIEPGTNGTDALLPPIVVGVATHAVAVTPHVPVAIGSDDQTQYVYAIDAVDGSVLVTENGQLLNVNASPNARADRLELGDLLHYGTPPAAAALSVITPYFDVYGPAGQYVTGLQDANGTVDPAHLCVDEDHEEETPARLRGVFLAIATVDGTVRIVDVHDMELLDVTSRDSETKELTTFSCRPCPASPIPVVVRNHERLAQNFLFDADEEPVPLTPVTSQFSFVVDALPFNVRPDGTNGSPDAPTLGCMACGQALTRTFPNDAEEEDLSGDEDGGTAGESTEVCSGETPALLCSTDDPWTTSDEQWFAVYEGSLPGSGAGDGRFIAPNNPNNRTGSPEVAGSFDFCALGVLDEDSVKAENTGEDCAAQADKPAGDQLVVTSTLLGREGRGLSALKDKEIDRCADARKILEDDPKQKLTFGIRRAYSDRVVIETNLVTKVGELVTWEDVQRCLADEPMAFDVRTQRSFAVIGTNSGYQHRVTTDAAGRCVVDREADSLRRGRVRLGCTFRNHALQFRPQKPGPDDPVQVPPGGLELLIEVSTPSSKLVANLAALGFGTASVVPVALHYNDVDRRLYLVDIQDRGLVPMSLDPFANGVDTTDTFN